MEREPKLYIATRLNNESRPIFNIWPEPDKTGKDLIDDPFPPIDTKTKMSDQAIQKRAREYVSKKYRQEHPVSINRTNGNDVIVHNGPAFNNQAMPNSSNQKA